MRLQWLIGLCGLGYLAAELSGITVRPDSQFFEYGTRVLLAVGLYGAVAGISLVELRASRGLIVRAVTAGVVLKWLLIGGLFWLYFRHPYAFVLGLAVTQIDPLSVSHLLSDPRHPLSSRGRAILAAWSSFDDPVTVLLILAIGPLILMDPSTTGSATLTAYAVSLVMSVGLLVLVLALARAARGSVGVGAAILIAAIAAAVAMDLMLVPAVLGLFLRLPGDRVVTSTVSAAIIVATMLLGAALQTGVDPLAGMVLGLAAFIAQMVVAVALTRGLPRADRVGLALAQQNGITAIVLALWIEKSYPGAVAILGPAIVVVNVLHALGTLIQLRMNRTPITDGQHPV